MRANDELEIDAFDGDAESSGDFLEAVLWEGSEELLAQVVGQVSNLAGRGHGVGVVGDVGVKAAGADARGGDSTGKAGVAECVESVVDGGEAQFLVDVPCKIEEFVGGGMGLCGGECGVDDLTLARGSEPAGLEAISDGGDGKEHGGEVAQMLQA